ncbi:MAG: hypothetical protein QM479_04575 [Pseudomonadota bacterium]
MDLQAIGVEFFAVLFILNHDEFVELKLILPKNKQIVVPLLGMHRSGTSMFMRMLSLLGVDVGKNTLPANPDNKAGYWEDTAFLELNVNLVQAVGCDWRGFATRQLLLQAAEALKTIDIQPALASKISIYLSDQFQSSHWGWKDPRTMLTFPFWRRYLSFDGYTKIRPIILVRHPISSARSLEKVYPAECGQQKCLLATGMELWHDYYKILMSYIEDDWQIVMQHDLLDEQMVISVLRRCCEYIELTPKSVELAFKSINRNLISYQSPADEVFEDSRVEKMYTYFSNRARQQQQEFDERN